MRRRWGRLAALSEKADPLETSRGSLVGEQSRIINRIKATLARLGIRGFNPKLKKASERLGGLRTPEGEPIAPNTLAELRRDMVRRRLVNDQIRQIEDARLERLKQAPSDGPHAMVRLLARVIGVGIETADMLVQEVLSRNMRDCAFTFRIVERTAGDLISEHAIAFELRFWKITDLPWFRVGRSDDSRHN